MTTYTPEDVYKYAINGNSDRLRIALKVRENRINWYTTDDGCNALHQAIDYEQYDCIGILINSSIDVNSKTNDNDAALDIAAYHGYTECVELLLNRGADINSRGYDNQTALTFAANRGHTECVVLLLKYGAAIIDDDIDSYEPNNDFEDNAFTDCRPIILAEIEHRRKRAAFDAFIIRHIEYPPYINRIYSLCYPTDDLIVAAPDIGWPRAQSISNKYYFDEVFFYLHMHVAKVCTQASTNTTSSLAQLAADSDATSTLMTVLVDRLKLYLKPCDV
jgi:ankyrin repeat protein